MCLVVYVYDVFVYIPPYHYHGNRKLSKRMFLVQTRMSISGMFILYVYVWCTYICMYVYYMYICMCVYIYVVYIMCMYVCIIYYITHFLVVCICYCYHILVYFYGFT